MKKIAIIGIEGKKIKEITLPKIFNSEIREDIIHKVFETTKKQQPYGTYVLAGKDVAASGKQSHRRHKYKTLYGHGISRIPRKVLTRRGERFFWRGAFIPSTVGGMRAHPPRAIRRQKKINKKERKIAIDGAIAATASKKMIEKKYSKLKISVGLPIIIDSSTLEQKNKDSIRLLSQTLGIKIKPIKKIRPGKGKLRGRKYKKTRKILLITANDENATKLKNFGLDINKVNQLNILNLAPGGISGRITIWTEKAIKDIGGMK